LIVTRMTTAGFHVFAIASFSRGSLITRDTTRLCPHAIVACCMYVEPPNELAGLVAARGYPYILAIPAEFTG
jgi:hypothetical protein